MQRQIKKNKLSTNLPNTIGAMQKKPLAAQLNVDSVFTTKRRCFNQINTKTRKKIELNKCAYRPCIAHVHILYKLCCCFKRQPIQLSNSVQCFFFRSVFVSRLVAASSTSLHCHRRAVIDSNRPEGSFSFAAFFWLISFFDAHKRVSFLYTLVGLNICCVVSCFFSLSLFQRRN